MALTIQVQRDSVTRTTTGAVSICLRLTCFNGTTEVLNKTFTVIYKTGMSVANLKTKVIESMQAVIDEYHEQQTLMTGAGLATAIADIQQTLQETEAALVG